jgi:hypothetical protein
MAGGAYSGLRRCAPVVHSTGLSGMAERIPAVLIGIKPALRAVLVDRRLMSRPV